MVENDMGERIGGSHLLTKVGSQSRNSIAIDHLSLKKGSVGEGGQEKKSKAANKMEQEGGTMWDRQTNRMGQVCRATNQEEQTPGPSKTGWWG